MSRVGETVQLRKVFSQADFDAFAALSGDDNAIHVDPNFAAKSSFGRTVTHGMLLYTVLRGLIDRLCPGAAQASVALMFPAPSFAGEALRFSARLTAEAPARIAFEVVREADGTVTCSGSAEMAG